MKLVASSGLSQVIVTLFLSSTKKSTISTGFGGVISIVVDKSKALKSRLIEEFLGGLYPSCPSPNTISALE